jgi:hypothetical protein
MVRPVGGVTARFDSDTVAQISAQLPLLHGMRALLLAGHALGDAAAADVLQALAAGQYELTRLDLGGCNAMVLALRALSISLPRWPHLADLRIAGAEPPGSNHAQVAARIAAPLAMLGATMTRLDIPGLPAGLEIDRALALLTALVRLGLPQRWSDGITAAFAALTGLTHLECSTEPGSGCVASFDAALPQLTGGGGAQAAGLAKRRHRDDASGSPAAAAALRGAVAQLDCYG